MYLALKDYIYSKITHLRLLSYIYIYIYNIYIYIYINCSPSGNLGLCRLEYLERKLFFESSLCKGYIIGIKDNSGKCS